MNLQNGNCLELMKTLPDKSIDLFICDLPYGETNCKWDSKIDMAEFWSEFKRLRKTKRTACIHFCSTKFGYTLIKSWEKGYKMDMVWKKRNKTGGLQSRHRPMRNHEMVYFFYEQAPKYNRDKYHKRIQSKNPIVKEEGAIFGKGYEKGKEPPFCKSKFFEPLNPTSILEEKDNRINENNKSSVGWDIKYMDKPRVAHFEPKLPASVVEEETTYGISKEKAQKSGRKGFKGIGTQNVFDPPNPASVIEVKNKTIPLKDRKAMGESSGIYSKDKQTQSSFDPPNPASVLEEKFCKEYYQTNKTGMTKTDIYSKENIKKYHKENGVGFSPPNPASVVEEDAESNKIWGYNKPDTFKINKNGTNQNFDPKLPVSVVEEKWIKDAGKNGHGWDKHKPEYGKTFDPPNPVSVVEEMDEFGWSIGKLPKENRGKEGFKPVLPASVVEEMDEFGWDKSVVKEKGTKFNGSNFEPVNPVSVVEEDEPKSMFESTKVFIGKRHHQTEKPQDILEFFLKYWSDEGDTILDPTMGSGSTGVACKKLNRKFIGFELDEKIYKVAVDRVEK